MTPKFGFLEVAAVGDDTRTPSLVPFLSQDNFSSYGSAGWAAANLASGSFITQILILWHPITAVGRYAIACEPTLLFLRDS